MRDIVYSVISFSTSSFIGHDIGLVKPRQLNYGKGYWECAWYNTTIVKAKLEQIEIEHMDGTSVTLKDEDLSMYNTDY